MSEYKISTSMLEPLTAISPIDGRYAEKTTGLRLIFSEYGLIRYRVWVEVEWLKALAKHPDINELPELSSQAVSSLNDLVENFSVAEAKQVKALESKTRHDVKAVEYFIRQHCEADEGLRAYISYIHFACTSEDINNLAYGLMLKKAREVVLLPQFEHVLANLSQLAKENSALAMVSRTHGQVATPTTLGKEIGIYIHRLRQQCQYFTKTELLGKFNGAVGNYNAHTVAYPDLDWGKFTQQFISQFGLTCNPHTTQVEPHDYIARYLNVLTLSNSILIDLCRDIWGYIAIGYFRQDVSENQVGSSTMPHKVNPIDFENAEGNFEVANGLSSCLAKKLPISRWQRDLSDSTVLRNIGVVVAHTQIALDSLVRGLGKLATASDKISQDLENAWEVLAEPIQTVMRKHGIVDAYEQLKQLTRNREINQESLHQFIQGLNLPEQAKDELLALCPTNYLGTAKEQTKQLLKNN